MLSRLLVVLAAGLLLVAPASAQENKGDKAKLQGAWKVVMAQEDGKDTREEQRIHQVVVANDVMKFNLKDGGTVMEMTYSLDSGKKPKWIDLMVGKVVYLGIYELEGDTLKICFNERGAGPESKERATEFVTKPNSPASVLLVCTREKK